MSGNPFRASVHLQPTPTAAAPPTGFINTNNSRTHDARDYRRDTVNVHDASSTAPVKTKKSVRIESPTEIVPPHPVVSDADSPLFPASPPQANHAHYRGSSPPTSPAGFFDNFEDIEHNSVGKGDAEARGLTRPSKRYSGVHEAMYSPGGAPHNPFARTLATLEPQGKGNGELAGTRDRAVAERASPGISKASLDVESFKNLLMAGITSPRSSGPPPQSAPAPNSISASVFESSNSTDTSSVSRHFIFEPVHDPRPESPRTSYEMAGSDDERASLMAEQNNKKEKRKPPPAPKSRHGKLVSSRGPQTVSFESFAATDPTSSPPPTIKRSNSDLNKPLPPTPVALLHTQSISQDSTQDLPFIQDSNRSDTASLTDAVLSQKRAPPPVPLARRHSQLRNSAVGNRSRSNSTLTISSQHSIDFPIPSAGLKEESEPPTSSSSPSPKAPPPPPPTRHRGAALASSANSSSTELSSSVAARRPTITSPTNSSSRQTTLSSEPPSPGLARTASVTSTRNSHRAVSNESSGSVMPPRPPPPRRRQSGRSSLDRERPRPSSPTENRRTSMEYKRLSPDSKRRTSVASESSLKHEYAPTSAAEGGEHALYSPREDEGEERGGSGEKIDQGTSTATILDDMDRFQKEIEELRAKYAHAA